MAKVERLLLALSVSASLLMSGIAAAQPTDNGAVPSVLVPAGSSSPQLPVGNNTINSNGAPTEPARITRDGVPSVCGTAKTFPGTIAGAGFAYQTLSYTNGGQTGCVTLSLSNTCSGGGNTFGTFLSAYNGVFDPNNLATNYLGDTGSSPGTPPTPNTTESMSLLLAAGQTITLVVNQVNDTATDPASTCTYSIDAVAPLAIPTMSSMALLLTALALAALGFGVLHRRAGRA